jgi:hypothetical protein
MLLAPRGPSRGCRGGLLQPGQQGLGGQQQEQEAPPDRQQAAGLKWGRWLLQKCGCNQGAMMACCVVSRHVRGSCCNAPAPSNGRYMWHKGSTLGENCEAARYVSDARHSMVAFASGSASCVRLPQGRPCAHVKWHAAGGGLMYSKFHMLLVETTSKRFKISMASGSCSVIARCHAGTISGLGARQTHVLNTNMRESCSGLYEHLNHARIAMIEVGCCICVLTSHPHPASLGSSCGTR